MSDPMLQLPGPPPHKEASPLEALHRAHRLLRGRYVLAAVLAALGAVAGATAGYMSGRQLYTSTGAVRIRTVLPVKVFQNEVNQQIYNPFEMARTHANLLQDARVIDRAMRSSEWQGLGRRFDEVERDRFIASLRVLTSRDEPSWIRVQFSDVDRRATKVAVEQIFNAYREIHGPNENLFDQNFLEELRQQKKAKESEIRLSREQIVRLERSMQTTNLPKLMADTQEQFSQLDAAARGLEGQIAMAEAAEAGREAKGEPAPEPTNGQSSDLMSRAAALAVQDRIVAEAYSVVTMAERELAERRLMLGPKSRELARLESRVQVARDLLATAVREASLRGVGGPAGEAAVGAISDIPQARARLDVLVRQRDAMKKALYDMQDAQAQISLIEAGIKATEEVISSIDRRIKSLEIEMRPDDTNVAGRIELQPVDTPFRPSSDNRVRLGLMGAVLGGGVPLGLVMLLGLLDRRVRYSDDADDPRRRLTLLGVLPYLPNDLADPEQASVAAHCVHHIRTLLQIGGADHSRRVFAITSPTSGDGKTSLAMSLGLSFAASGARTLLIDFDMIGGGLSSAMGVKTSSGLLDAVLQGELNGFARPTGFARLDLLPVGSDDARDVSSLSLELVRRTIQQARDGYDAVIIDTGPILGSLEASLVCAAADGTILTLGRGQQRTQAERALDHLSGIGATFLGVVFNRAEPGDFRRAVSSASVRSRPLSEQERAARPGELALLSPLGPMARTVASQIRTPGTPEEERHGGDLNGR